MFWASAAAYHAGFYAGLQAAHTALAAASSTPAQAPSEAATSAATPPPAVALAAAPAIARPPAWQSTEEPRQQSPAQAPLQGFYGSYGVYAAGAHASQGVEFAHAPVAREYPAEGIPAPVAAPGPGDGAFCTPHCLHRVHRLIVPCVHPAPEQQIFCTCIAIMNLMLQV